MGKLSSKEVKELIDREIKWHKQNSDKFKDLSDKEKEAFVAGLLQVKLLIDRIEQDLIF